MKSEQVFIPNHSPALFDRAEQSSKRGEGVSSCILAVSATEAFIHDLTEWYKFAADYKSNCHNNKKKSLFRSEFHIYISFLHMYTDLEDSILKKITDIESRRENGSLMKKYLELHALCKDGEKADKGANPYQDFSLLVSIRNDIVHTKGERLSIFNETPDINGYPTFIKTLSQKKIIETDKKFSSWLNLIENKKFAEWSLETAKGIIENAINMLPETKLSGLFKEQACV